MEDVNKNQEGETENTNIQNEVYDEEGEMQNEGESEGENELMYIYEWVDSIPLSRQKKNIARDFNDAVLLAEIIKYHEPKLVEMHNYPSACSTKQKLSNWNTLNRKVFQKIGLKVSKEEIHDVMNSKPNAIENLLSRVYRYFHGMPQQDNQNKKVTKGTKNNHNEGKMNKIKENKLTNEEEGELQELILEKDQEIMSLKERIENLEKQITESNSNQEYLENKLKEYNEIIRKNEIDF